MNNEVVRYARGIRAVIMILAMAGSWAFLTPENAGELATHSEAILLAIYGIIEWFSTEKVARPNVAGPITVETAIDIAKEGAPPAVAKKIENVLRNGPPPAVLNKPPHG